MSRSLNSGDQATIPVLQSTMPEIPTPIAEIECGKIWAISQSCFISISVSRNSAFAVVFSDAASSDALAKRLPPKSVSTAVWRSSDSLTPIT